jgi:hypothetical protein
MYRAKLQAAGVTFPQGKAAACPVGFHTSLLLRLLP